MGTWTTEVWKPTQILDNEKNIFVHDSSNGICLFDVFGNFYKSIDITGLVRFSSEKDQTHVLSRSIFDTIRLQIFQKTIHYTPIRMQ